jgi:hypothetical protein
VNELAFEECDHGTKLANSKRETIILVAD